MTAEAIGKERDAQLVTLNTYDSLIMNGVTIGHGAIVAARAVVVKDVPRYSIRAIKSFLILLPQ